ncbi:MAG TPA: NAD-dependent epimerase/dehydratase family protein [Thermohalobaculum sp.]|nr:NAD-dependent epimerase/dehydratase family protein [Thermohalobaculum sp.]
MSRPTLVTGAGGFLGGHVVAALAGRGEAVRALDLAFPAPLAQGVERIEGSILDPDLMARAAQGTAAVIHCAALTDLWARRRVLYDRVNTRGTCEVLVAARRAGARVVHVSSYVTLVGGPDAGAATLDETVELPPSALLGPYPRTKREAELFALSAARMGHDVVVVMPSAPVGPGDWRLTPPTRMIRDLAAGRTPALLDCLINLVDVRAVAEGVIAARDRGRSGARYLLTGEDLEMAGIAARIGALAGVRPPRWRVPPGVALAAARVEAALASVTGRPPKAPLTGVRLAARRVRFSSAKARAELGFDPPPVEAALADAVDWLRAAGMLAR